MTRQDLPLASINRDLNEDLGLLWNDPQTRRLFLKRMGTLSAATILTYHGLSLKSRAQTTGGMTAGSGPEHDINSATMTGLNTAFDANGYAETVIKSVSVAGPYTTLLWKGQVVRNSKDPSAAKPVGHLGSHTFTFSVHLFGQFQTQSPVHPHPWVTYPVDENPAGKAFSVACNKTTGSLTVTGTPVPSASKIYGYIDDSGTHWRFYVAYRVNSVSGEGTPVLSVDVDFLFGSLSGTDAYDPAVVSWDTINVKGTISSHLH